MDRTQPPARHTGLRWLIGVLILALVAVSLVLGHA
jgi:hypothetical protein